MYTTWEAEESTRRRSQSCILIKYGNAPIFATGCLQKSVALSSTETEYLALSNAGRSLVLLWNVLNEMANTQKCTLIQQDNTGAIDVGEGKVVLRSICLKGNTWILYITML